MMMTTFGNLQIRSLLG